MMTEVKEYLSHHHIPQLLESLLTGLLYHHPEDPVSFLQSCLIKTRQLGGPEAITWDAFIPLERNQLSSGPPKTTSLPPIPSLPQKKPQTTQTPPPRPQIPPTTPSMAPKTTTIPPIAPSVPPIKPQTFQPTSPIPPITGPMPPKTTLIPPIKPQIAPPRYSEPQKPKISVEPKVLIQTPAGPALTTQPVHTEMKEQRDPKTFSTEAPHPGPPSSPVRSQLSIDSDSDLTESSGLRQEVSIIRPQRPLIIFIIGGPGSGKGSQAARLARCFSFRVISLDELLRRQLLSHASASRKWKVISEMMGHGELGPQEETISELRRQLIGRQEVRGFIVEGFPRDVHQALGFQEQIGSPDVVMLLLCSNEMLRCRLQRRAAQLGLLGDNSRALRRRLEVFQRDVVSVRRYYRQLHLLTQVDGDADEDVIFADLSSVIREKLKDSGPADIPECSSAVRSVNQ